MTTDMHPSKQARRLLKLAEIIEHNEGAFDMGTWINVGGVQSLGNLDERIQLSDDAPPLKVKEYLAKHKSSKLTTPTAPIVCGTTACIGGWAVLTWPKEALAAGYETIEMSARTILGIGTDDDLFSSDASWDTAEKAVDELRRRAIEIISDL